MLLEGTNFELTITAYRYLAVLFYDDSPKGQQIQQMWKKTATILKNSLPDDCEIGMVNTLLTHNIFNSFPDFLSRLMGKILN